MQSHAPSERVSDHVRPVQSQVVDQRGDVIGHEAQVDRPVDVCGPPVALEVHEDDLVVVRQGGQHRSVRLPETSLPWSRIIGWPVPWTS